MMKHVPVVFVSADPLRTLTLGEDLRRVQEKVRAAEYRDVLDFDVRPAAQVDDLVQALYETRPQIVHFSGHGDSEGLMLAGRDGRTPHWVSADALRELFEAFRDEIRLVVLSACSTGPQARAIAEVVGCAVGTPAAIDNDAAIIFNAEFYRAIAFGESVEGACKKACAVLATNGLGDVRPEVFPGPGVDASKLVLIPDPDLPGRESASPPPSPQAERVEQTNASSETPALQGERKPVVPRVAGGALLFFGLVFAGVEILGGLRGGDDPPIIPLIDTVGAATALTGGNASQAAADLAAGRELHRVGNYAASFPLFKRAAEAGNTEAMGFLGLAYLRGEGTQRVPELTAHWLSQAADARDARGMNAYGLAYEDGFGVGQSYRWARHWYEAAATEKNDVEAMRNLGRHHRQGLGIGRSDSLALHWYRKAVDAGSVDAMVDVGLMYAEGVQGRRDTGEALRWLQRAAQAGSSRAMHAIGRLYEDARDYAQALAWYQKAADAGSVEAMNNLGVLYQNGWGVAPNRAQAARWYRQAAEAGSPVAAGNLRALEGG